MSTLPIQCSVPALNNSWRACFLRHIGDLDDYTHFSFFHRLPKGLSQVQCCPKHFKSISDGEPISKFDYYLASKVLHFHCQFCCVRSHHALGVTYNMLSHYMGTFCTSRTSISPSASYILAQMPSLIQPNTTFHQQFLNDFQS